MIDRFRLDELAVDFVANADKDTKRVRSVNEASKNNDLYTRSDLERYTLQAWIATPIDCGLDWILRFPDSLKEGTEEKDGKGAWDKGVLGAIADERLEEAATWLLGYFGVQVDHGDERHKTMTRFLTCVVDPRLLLLQGMARRLPLAAPGIPGGDSLIASPVSNRSYFAVPSALAHLPPWKKRAWVIEPFDPDAPPEQASDHLGDPNTIQKDDELTIDVIPVYTSDMVGISKKSARREPRNDERGTWRMRRQEIVFGSRPWTGPESGAPVLLKRQRVYGGVDYDWPAMLKVMQAIMAGTKASRERRAAGKEAAEN
ncbi:hypothetical protein B0T17DRAFT_500969 [Bombardia bombarda]|uniref:Uncharacterized protein n=1 Tax=Bombardia bombarda TaxID=252184 RepID=A0AA39WBH5_9PEZI|nr:hypothetical protein B0T17DRAFT_500969 [Bombardia bombarda]